MYTDGIPFFMNNLPFRIIVLHKSIELYFQLITHNFHVQKYPKKYKIYNNENTPYYFIDRKYNYNYNVFFYGPILAVI